MRKLTNSEFLNRLQNKNIHWKPVEKYKGSKVKIKFNCEKHGLFLARPNDILSGQGCPSCGGTKKMDVEEFVSKASYVHDNFFSYENCGFISTNSFVYPTCPIHGRFKQKANNHLNGQGCKKCKNENITHLITKLGPINKSTCKLTDENFKQKFFAKFGEKYNLNETKYINARTIFYPTCSIHGPFPITPNHLMSGRGCPKCAENYHYTKEELIDKFKQIHGTQYDYSLITDATTHQKINIICLQHGIFSITPANHLKGGQCPKCNSSKMQVEIRTLLKDNDISFNEEQKFSWLNRLVLDFYLPEYNIAIECQGIQHFEPVNIFGGHKSFVLQQTRDKNKLNACKKNNINLLYYANYIYQFPYSVITDKNILLKKILTSKTL